MPAKPNASYAEQRAKELTLRSRELLKTLPEICAEFTQALAPNTQPLTRYAYLCDIRIFCEYLLSEVPEFADKSIPALKPADFEDVTPRILRSYLEYLDYYIKDDNERSNSDVTKMRKLSSLRRFYEFMYKAEYIASDVTKLVDLPKRREKPIIRLEIDEAARMLDNVESGEGQPEHQRHYNDHTRKRDLTILTLFLGTGMRVSELVGLNVGDVDFSINGLLVTRKGGKQTILYFPQEVADTLQDYMVYRRELEPAAGHEDALFLSLQNKRISVRAVQTMVKKYAEPVAPLKKHLSPHKLRSTFGTNLYRETGDIYVVADVLGHSDVNTTRRHYAAMSEDLRREAAKKVYLREDPTDKK